VQRHDVVLLHLDRHQIDPDIAAQCVAVHTVGLSDPGPWAVRVRGAASMLRGRSLKAASSSVLALRRQVGDLMRRSRPEVVQVEFGVLGDALAAARGALRVITIHDPAATLGESLPLRRDGLPFVHRLDARVALREERRVLRLADAAVVFTERDRRLIEGSARDTELATIPLAWDVPPGALDPSGSLPPTLLFIGNFAHPPNVDAALRLAREILPAVQEAHPGVRLELVGEAPSRELLALANERVDVTGAVPSVTPYLDRAAIVVAPLAIGGGMRVKVLEALAAGKAVVASARAAEGVTAAQGEDLVVVDGAYETAAAIRRLLEDDGARRRMAGRARTWALRELSWSVMADRYDELYERLERRYRARP
jgi:glycosyltransferase involved in cell wall biosynthesis